jgi:hypothetical protein
MTGEPNRAYCFFHTLAQIPDGAPGYRIYYLHLLTHPASTHAGANPKCNPNNCYSSGHHRVCESSGTSMPLSTPPNPECVYTDSNGKLLTPSALRLPLPAGTHVTAGCEIARSGNAGVNGPHLHFEVQQIFPREQINTATLTVLLGCFDEKTYTRPLNLPDITHFCLPLDPYGWKPSPANCPDPNKCPDPYQSLTGIPPQQNLWAQ